MDILTAWKNLDGHLKNETDGRKDSLKERQRAMSETQLTQKKRLKA